MRQQLRKRGLPVSGTKPALLQRLRLFQLPRLRVPPAPLCQLGTGLEPPHTPSSSSSSRLDSPTGSPGQPFSVTDRGIPIEILAGSPDGVPEGGALSTNGYPLAVPVTLSGDGGGLGNAVFLAPASTSSGTPSPSLPMSCSSPLSCATPLRHEGGQPREPGAEEKRRLRSRSRTCTLGPGDEVSRVRCRPVKQWVGANASASFSQGCGGSLHPFLQQDPGRPQSRAEAEVGTAPPHIHSHISASHLWDSVQAYGCQPCDVIGRDFELPVQITASPAQDLACGLRSLEEELQEAIQKAQVRGFRCTCRRTSK